MLTNSMRRLEILIYLSFLGTDPALTEELLSRFQSLIKDCVGKDRHITSSYRCKECESLQKVRFVLKVRIMISELSNGVGVSGQLDQGEVPLSCRPDILFLAPAWTKVCVELVRAHMQHVGAVFADCSVSIDWLLSKVPTASVVCCSRGLEGTMIGLESPYWTSALGM